MMLRNWIRAVASAAIVLGSTALYADDAPKAAAAAPATQPAAQKAATVSPDAQKLIDQVSSAYSGLKSLDLKGTLNTNIDAGGKKQNETMNFTAAYRAPNEFRHTMQGDVTCGSTGSKAYAFAESRNIYRMDDAPKTKVAVDDLPGPLKMILPAQNPSLTLAIAADPAKTLLASSTDVATGDAVKLGDASYPTLRMTGQDKTVTTMAFDPSTHLLRQAVMDLKAMAEGRGVPDVKNAVITIDYTATTTNTPMTDEQFAWAPPAGAKDASKMAAEQQGQDATALVGKPAPTFKIKSLEGKDVALADYKGKVVLLDFWATWCGPCRMSLPHIQEIYESHKKDGLIGYAVDLAEEKPLVEKFVTTAKMTIPVLLDTEGKTGEAYSADAIPETVLIGKDGKIKNVWIGVTEPSVITKAVEEALHG